MAYEIPGFKFTLPAAADLSASQYCFVVANSSSQAALVTTAIDASGVLCNKPNAAGVAAEIGTLGIYKVKAGAAVAAGARLMADGSGRGITLSGATSKGLGIALSACSNANEIITAFIAPLGTL